MEPAPPAPPPVSDEKRPSRVGAFLGWVLATLAASVVLAGVWTFLAWRSAQEEVAAPVAALLGGLAQVTGNLKESDVEEVVQQVTAVVPLLAEEVAAVPPAAVTPADAALPVDAAVAEAPDAAVTRPRVRPDPTQPMAWYDDEGQAHITLPEAVPLKYRAALGLD